MNKAWTAIVMGWVLVSFCPSGMAQSAESSAEKENKLARELLDLGEYDAALERVVGAREALVAAGYGQRPIASELEVTRGLILALKGDDGKAYVAFKTAIQIEKGVTLPKNVDKLSVALFEKAYNELYPTIDCEKLLGVWHTQISRATEGATATIEAKVDKRVAAMTTMQVRYRGPKGGDYQSVDMRTGEGCTVVGEIPSSEIAAPRIEYYLEGIVEDGRPGVRRGGPDNPFVVAVSFAASEPTETEPVNIDPVEEEALVEEVPEELGAVGPRQPKGTGCAGCSGQGSGGGIVTALVLLALMGRSRRGRIAAT